MKPCRTPRCSVGSSDPTDAFGQEGQLTDVTWTETTEPVSLLVLQLSTAINRLKRRAADLHSTWLYEGEADSLRQTLNGALERAERLRFIEDPEERLSRLTALSKGLPWARLRQLLESEEDDHHSPEAA
jgi:hypothetical protein